jgi:DNA transposition AAA+ family ATPase
MQEIPFIETTIASRVFGIINLAKTRSENAAIIGEPGVGKTRAVNAYVQRHDGSYLMTVNAITGNALRDLLRELASLLGIHVSGSIANTLRQMLAYDFTGRVLIIDEAQNLKLQAIRELLNLHDHAGMSIVFCGNRDVLKRVNVEHGPLAQISDRVGLREQIECIPAEDADAITNSFGVEGMDAYALARAVGLRFKARALVRVLNAAREDAGKRTIKAANIRQAIALHPQYAGVLK